MNPALEAIPNAIGGRAAIVASPRMPNESLAVQQRMACELEEIVGD